MENWKLLLAGIRNALSDLVNKTFNIKGEVSVSNLPAVQHVVIDNQQEPTEKVEVSNLVDYKEELNKIIGELIKVPKDIKTADYSPIIKALQDVVKTLEADKTDYSPIILSISSAVKELKDAYPTFNVEPIVNTIKGLQQFNLDQYLKYGELPVVINAKQYENLIKAFGKQVAVAIQEGGGGSTVTATVDTTGLATSTIQTNGSQKTKVVDSAGTVQDWAMPEGQEASANSMPMVLSTEQEALIKNISDTTGLVDATPPSRGILIMGENHFSDVHTTEADGDADTLYLDAFGAVKVADQRTIDLDNCNATTGWSVLSNDTANIAVSTNHVFGTGALSFDKVNGAANTIYAGIQKTISPALDVAEIFEAGGFVGMSVYLSDITNVTGVSLRVGTDSSNYQAWYWDSTVLTAGIWMNLRVAAALPDYSRNTGNGWIPSAITYVCPVVEFAGETNTLAGIKVDHIHIVKGRITSTDIATGQSTATVASNVNISKIGNANVSTNGGVENASTLRVTLASNSSGQVKLAAGTNEIGKLAAGTALIGSINGSAAHDAADANNPVKIGAKASTSLAGLTLVADADRTNLFADIDGVQIVRQDAVLEDIVTGNASNTDGTSTQCIAASGANVKTYLTDVTLTNTSTTSIYVEIKDDTTTKWTFPVPANGGVTHHFRTPIPGTANKAWNFDPSGATTTVYCSMAGFKSKV